MGESHVQGQLHWVTFVCWWFCDEPQDRIPYNWGVNLRNLKLLNGAAENWGNPFRFPNMQQSSVNTKVLEYVGQS